MFRNTLGSKQTRGGDMAYDLRPGPNEVIHFQADLKKLTKGNGSKISDPVFKPFAIIENAPRREIYLAHCDSSYKEKRTRLQESICKVSLPSHKDFSRLPHALQIKFSADKQPPQVYVSNEQDFEKWCSWLQYILTKADYKPLIPVHIPSCTLPIVGPALLHITDGSILFLQPSTMNPVNVFPVQNVTSFGSTQKDVWFRVCHFCAKAKSADRTAKQTEYNMRSDIDMACTSFIAQMQEEGKAQTRGIWSMGQALNCESFLLNHANVCTADNLWFIKFEPHFLPKIATIFKSSWKKLARQAGFKVSDIKALDDLGGTKSTVHFLERWLTSLPPDVPSEPKKLLALTEAAELTKEALDLRHMFLDIEHSYARDRPRSPTGFDRHLSPELLPEPAPGNYGGSVGQSTARYGEHTSTNRMSSRPLPEPGASRRLPEQGAPSAGTLDARDTTLRSADSQIGNPDPSHPLSMKLLIGIGFVIEDNYAESWEYFPLQLLCEEDVKVIAAQNENLSIAMKVKKCLEHWKSTPARRTPPTAENLKRALHNARMPKAAKWYQDNVGSLEYLSNAVSSSVGNIYGGAGGQYGVQEADRTSSPSDTHWQPASRYSTPSNTPAPPSMPLPRPPDQHQPTTDFSPIYPQPTADYNRPPVPPPADGDPPFRHIPAVTQTPPGVFADSPPVPVRSSSRTPPVQRSRHPAADLQTGSVSGYYDNHRPHAKLTAQGDTADVTARLGQVTVRQPAAVPAQPRPKQRASKMMSRNMPSPLEHQAVSPSVESPPPLPTGQDEPVCPVDSSYDMPLPSEMSAAALDGMGTHSLPTQFRNCPPRLAGDFPMDDEPDGMMTSPYVNQTGSAQRVTALTEEDELRQHSDSESPKMPRPLPRSGRSSSEPGGYMNVSSNKHGALQEVDPLQESPYTTLHKFGT